MVLLRRCAAIATCEHQIIRHGRVRPEYLRFLHISPCLRVDDPSSKLTNNGQISQVNVSQRGPSRQQRSAMISEEIRMIQRDHPKPSFAEPDPNTLRPAGASKTIDPEAVGADRKPGRMGEAFRRPSTDGIEAAPANPVGTQTQAEREAGAQPGVVAPSATTRPDAEGYSSLPITGSATTSSDLQAFDQAATKLTTGLVESTDAHREQLLYSGAGTSTIAGGNYRGIMADQLHQLVELGQQKLPHSAGQKTRRARVRRMEYDLVKSMVGGIYRPIETYTAEQDPLHPTLGHVADQTLLNGTFHATDAKKFLNKLSGLLPNAPPSTQSKEQSRPAAAAHP